MKCCQNGSLWREHCLLSLALRLNTLKIDWICMQIKADEAAINRIVAFRFVLLFRCFVILLSRCFASCFCFVLFYFILFCFSLIRAGLTGELWPDTVLLSEYH